MNELNELESYNHMSNPEISIEDDNGYIPEKNRLTTYTLKDCTYRIPAYADSLCYTFEKILVILDERTISSSEPEDKLYLSKSGQNEFKLLINHLREQDQPIYDPEDIVEKENVEIYLYKENIEEPIFQAFKEPDNDCDIYIDLNEDLKRLTPGNYFFLFSGIVIESDTTRLETMSGHARFSFTILESGKDLPHPDIRSARISRPKEEHGASCFTAGTIQLTLQMDRPAELRHEYKAECFSESLQFMGKATNYIRENRLASKNFHFSFYSQTMWYKGKYFIVLSHNDEPFARIDFQWQGHTCEMSGIRLIETDDKDYLIVKSVSNNHLYWEYIRELPGATDIKWNLLMRENRHQLNDTRSRLNIAHWKYNANFILIGPDSAARRKLAEYIPHILQPHQRTTKFVQAGKVIETYNPSDPKNEITSLLHDSCRSTICLSELDALQFSQGQTIIRLLREKLLDDTASTFLGLTGTKDEIDRFFEIAPDMLSLFPQENHFAMQPPTLHEFLCAIQKELANLSLSLSERAQSEMIEKLTQLWNESLLSSWDSKVVKQFIEKSILPGMEQRLLSLLHDRQEDNLALFTTVEPQDIDYSMFANSPNLFEQNMQSLNDMIGLQILKQNLSKTFCQIRFNNHRKKLGLYTEDESCHHMIFTGNPGTGKTTVAKMIGNIYHAMGLLSKGNLIVTERSQIVGTYIGETEMNMTDLLEQAKGNVLFIDEAYTLYNGHDDTRDFGRKAIECLLTALSKKNPDMLVIMAGYDKEMEQMLEANQGLKGRFPHHFHFENYSAGELMQIAGNLLRKQEYVLTEDAENLLRKVVSETIGQSDRHFSNARWMEQFLTHGVLPAMAERIMAEEPDNDRVRYQTIIREDIEQAQKRQTVPTVALNAPRRCIGFTA